MFDTMLDTWPRKVLAFILAFLVVLGATAIIVGPAPSAGVRAAAENEVCTVEYSTTPGRVLRCDFPDGWCLVYKPNHSHGGGAVSCLPKGD